MRKIYTLLCIALFSVISVNSYSQKLSAEQTRALETKVHKADIGMYQNLIMFNLTQDMKYYDQAMSILDTRAADFQNLKENGTGDDYFKMSVSFLETIISADQTLYKTDYFVKGITEDKEAKNKKIKYNGGEYTVSKAAAKKHDSFKEKLDKANKYYGDK